MATKTTEQKVQEHTADRLMEYLIGKTYARHSLLDEKEFLKSIGFGDANLPEEKAVRMAGYNVLVALTKEVFAMRDTVQRTNALLKTLLIEQEKGGEE